MESLPLYIPISFIGTTLLTLIVLFKGSNQLRSVLAIGLLWLLLQAVIGLSGFYTITDTIPPRFLLAVSIPFLTILSLFLARGGRKIISNWDLRWLTWLHIVRVPVELVLYWLFLHKKVPQLMTFEGINYDILSGLTVPLIVWLGFRAGEPRRKLLLIWNIICLGLLLNIVIHAFLSAPLPFQQLAFDQPNIAVLYFPYVWLPAFIVPVVLLAHLVSIRLLLRKNKS